MSEGMEEPSQGCGDSGAGAELPLPARAGPKRYKTAWFCNNLRALPNQRRRCRHVPAPI